MRKALVFGGSGQIGAAVAHTLARANWQITAVTRDNRPLPFPENDQIVRYSGAATTRSGVIDDLGHTFDAVIDPTTYNSSDSADLLAAETKIGAVVAISSSSVYADSEGRSLDEARDTGFPELPVGIPETTPTVAPGPETYSTQKIAMEQALENAKVPVVILRPCAVYGVYARELRESWFLRRLADSRPIVPVSYNAESVFHTSSAAGIASLIECGLRNPQTMTLNVADPEAPMVKGIVKALETVLEKEIPILPFDGDPVGLVGRTPWSVPRPYALDISRAQALGWEGGRPYADEIKAVCRWARRQAAETSWEEAFPLYKAYGINMFDYETEDQFLATQ